MNKRVKRNNAHLVEKDKLVKQIATLEKELCHQHINERQGTNRENRRSYQKSQRTFRSTRYRSPERG